jgi:hypothetical protein
MLFVDVLCSPPGGNNEMITLILKIEPISSILLMDADFKGSG